MALFDQYEDRRGELLKKMQTLEDFEKSDSNVKNILDIARDILMSPKDAFNPDKLVNNGRKLSAYYGYLLTRGNEAWAEYKMAEIAFREVRDALMLAIKVDKATITEAKASAGRDTAILEVDVLLREKRSRDYEATAKWCQAMLSFIQSTLSQMKNERTHGGLADHGKQ
jgi:hypothetical protein